MVEPIFRPHGASHIVLSGATLVVHIYGHWNAEMRLQVAKEMQAYAPDLSAVGPWGIINFLHDTVVFSDEIYTRTRQDYASRPITSGLKAVAFVIEDGVEGAMLMRPRFQSLLQGVIAAQTFVDLDSAQAWMDQQLTAA